MMKLTPIIYIMYAHWISTKVEQFKLKSIKNDAQNTENGVMFHLRNQIQVSNAFVEEQVL